MACSKDASQSLLLPCAPAQGFAQDLHYLLAAVISRKLQAKGKRDMHGGLSLFVHMLLLGQVLPHFHNPRRYAYSDSIIRYIMGDN